jgi:3-hydroxybutyryl-CoA dehydratase
MTHSTYFDDIQVGDELPSSSITITEAHVVAFAGLTGDFAWLHMDAETMRDHHFGERVAHGPLTLVMTMGQLAQTITHRQWVVRAALGIGDVAFTAPVTLGTTLTFGGLVEDLRPGRTTGAVRIRMSATTPQAQEVMSGHFDLLVAQRTA